MPHWKRNLVVLGVVQVLTMVAFSSYMPLVPYYLLELGAGSYEETTSWAAIYSTGSALAMMISAPIWGSLGDRRGRKAMLVRATLAGVLGMCANYLVGSPAQLVAVRIFQGFMGGSMAAVTTLVATETPDRYLGVSLGLLQTLQAGARAVGPLAGGVIADTLGLRQLFVVSAVIMFVAFLAVAVLVRERADVRDSRRDRPGTRSGPGMLAGLMTRDILVMLGVMATMGTSIALISPVLSLYVKSLSPDSQRIATLAGAISSATAFTSVPAALLIGRLGDRFGAKAVLIACGLGATLVHVPQALVSSPMQLLALRAVQGVFTGGINPVAMALLARSTRPARRGTVLGLASSARAGGRAIGPLVGAASANLWGMPSVFLVTAGVYGLMSLIVSVVVRPRAEPVSTATEEPAVPIASDSETAGARRPCGS